MQIYHTPFFCHLRALLRKLRVTRFINSLGIGTSKNYEDHFGAAMMRAVRAGDCVWDVGANVGFYSTKFASKVGVDGFVVAFEPFPRAVELLKRELAEVSNAAIVEAALGDTCSTASLSETEGNGVSTTCHLVDDQSSTASALSVCVVTADSVGDTFGLRLPTVTKVDVEGYEEEVLLGGKSVFRREESREIFIEVHFRRLAERGMVSAPQRIVGMLKQWGYRVVWTDPSHVHAFRPQTGG